jgi:hypothetical protein
MLKILLFNILLAVNPAHVTMTSIEHIHGTDSLKVMIKMNYDLFLRDYQTIDDDRDLHKLYSYKPFPEVFVNNYISSKVFIYVNNKLLEGKLLTMDLIEGELSLKFLYQSSKTPRKITVRNTILTRLYSDQVNLTILRFDDFEKGIKLTPEHIEETFTLN